MWEIRETITWRTRPLKTAERQKGILPGRFRMEHSFLGYGCYQCEKYRRRDSTAVGPLEFDVLSNGKPTVAKAEA